MFAASRNITLTMTSSMVKETQKAHRRRYSNSSSLSSSSGTKTPKHRNRSRRSSRSISPISFDAIWSDLVADTKLYPSEGQDITNANTLPEAECQIGRSLFEEGRAHANSGRHQEAINKLTQALTAQRQSELGENSPLVARTLVERGSASAALGLLYDSVLDLEKALLIERRISGDDESESLDVANAYLRVGQVQHKRGNFVEAVHCFECALAIRQRVLGANDIRVTRVICILAVAHHQRKKYEAALEYYAKFLTSLKGMHMAKDSPEYLWLRRCVADKNLYFDRVEAFWDDDNAI